jgi:hypothetical protein
MMMPTIKRMESPVLPLAASPVGHERGAIVFRTLARETASEARISDLPVLTESRRRRVRHPADACTFDRPRRHARYDGDPDMR